LLDAGWHPLHMTTTDPLLKQLVADTAEAEESIPLTLYLPSGKLFGHTTSGLLLRMERVKRGPLCSN
jgi:hypothetical protein